MENLTEYLQNAGVKPTANRLMIARALDRADSPLSLAELETRLETIDRSNIFRALSLFRRRHMVHIIDDGSESVKYELCRSDSRHDDNDSDLHLHFHCEECHSTTCLEQIPIPSVSLPDGYIPLSANYVVKGLCPACAAKRGQS